VTPGVNVVIAYRVQVNFPLDNGTVIENVATVNDSFAGHAAFDIGPARTTVRSSPNLGTSTKAVNLAEASPGDELVYTITLVNTGNMTAHNAVVLDEIPAHTAYVALSAQASSGNVQYQPAYNRIRWTGEVVPGVNVVITYHVQVNSPLNDGTEIENFATVDDGVHSPFDTNTVVTVIHSAPDLSTSSKTVDLADAVPGQVLHYVITLRNTGDMAAVTAVTDQLPAGVTHAGGPTVQNGPPASWDPIARRISWSGNVVPGTNVTIEYYVTVNSPLNDGTVIENTATINDGVHPAFETAPAAQTTIHSAPDLTGSTKEVSRTVAPPGETIEYTITLNNDGSMSAPAVMMTDTLPTEVSFVSGPIVTGGGTASYDPVARQIRWSGPVNVNQPVTIRYTVRLNAGLTAGIIVENTATVDDGRGNVFDIGPATTYVGHELGLSLRDNRDTVQPAERITYTVAFSGTEPLNSGTVRIDIPAHATLIAQSPGGINNGVSVDWSLLALPPGFYSERYIVVQLEPVLDNGTVISTTAYIAGDGQSNTATEEAVVVSAPDWETSVKTADRFDVEPGAQFTYTIRLANTGNMHAHAATLEDLAVCAATADALGKPQIVSPFPHNVSDARLALAATYALGQYYLVPWDVWMGPEKPRHFGTVEDYGDLFHFVRDNPGLLDDYEAPGVVGVVVDTDRYDAGRMRSVVGKVLRARVPFCFVLLGRKYYHVPLDPQRLARFAALICLDEFESYAEEDRAALASVAHEVGRLSDRQATPDLLSRLAPVQVWGPEDVYVLPRVSLDPADRTLILHVLNRVREAEGQPVVPLRYLSVGLRGEALLGARVESATWHAPGEETRELEVDDLPTGPRLIIPELRRWGIARVRFAAP